MISSQKRKTSIIVHDGVLTGSAAHKSAKCSAYAISKRRMQGTLKCRGRRVQMSQSKSGARKGWKGALQGGSGTPSSQEPMTSHRLM